MILVFTTTFIIITSTSVAHGPFAAHAASTKQQQNKHKSTVTAFDSIDNVNNVPEGSTQSGITRPGKNVFFLCNCLSFLKVLLINFLTIKFTNYQNSHVS